MRATSLPAGGEAGGWGGYLSVGGGGTQQVKINSDEGILYSSFTQGNGGGVVLTPFTERF